MRQIAVMAALAVGVSVMSVAAQGRNFSGTWVVDAEKTAAAAPAGGGGGGGGVISGGGGGETRAIRSAGGGGGGVGGSVRSAEGGGAVMTRSAASGSAETVITLDASTFTVEVGGVKTSYPTNGTETPVEVRGLPGRAVAKWHGDVLTITTTYEAPNGPVTSSQSWSLEGELLVREAGRKMYYKRK